MVATTCIAFLLFPMITSGGNEDWTRLLVRVFLKYPFPAWNPGTNLMLFVCSLEDPMNELPVIGLLFPANVDRFDRDSLAQSFTLSSRCIL